MLQRDVAWTLNYVFEILDSWENWWPDETPRFLERSRKCVPATYPQLTAVFCPSDTAGVHKSPWSLFTRKNFYHS